MHIPFIYVLFIAEAVIVLLALSIILGLLAYRFANRKIAAPVVSQNKPTVNLGSTYIENLDSEIAKNNAQSLLKKRSPPVDAKPSPADAAIVAHSELLTLRALFLTNEHTAAEHAGNNIVFWEKIYAGLKVIADRFKSSEQIVQTVVSKKNDTREKVFYIETQGKKVDGEVNRLKDIIFDQENTLSDLMKSLKKAETEPGDIKNNAAITELRAQLGNFERQIRDSKTCMDVLELENNRLQEELTKLLAEKAATESADSPAADDSADVQSMREALKHQKNQISSLIQTIDDLKLTAEQANKIKATLNDFARSSQEMMSCITILEEENERLTALGAGNGAAADSPEMKAQIKKLEEELIKKDVAYAKLQDEFSSIEKEYLSMYNTIHGENG